MNLGRAFALTVAIFGLSACASLFDHRQGAYDQAPMVDNPAAGGQVATAVDAGMGGTGRSEVRMQSYDRKSGRLCVIVKTPNPDALKEIRLVGYRSAADFEGKAPQGEVPASIKTLSTATAQESYETKETVTHKDSMGRVVATSEKPVTKVSTYKTYDMALCYPGKVLNDKVAYLGLEHKMATLFGPQTSVVGAWRFASADVTP